VEQALKGSLDFETLEGVVRETSLRIGAEVLESMINSVNDDIFPSMTHPDDGTVLRYVGKRKKTFVTVLGDITLQRAYHTDGDGRGYFPRDEQLGLDKDCLSAGVKRMIGHTASVLSFKESSHMIENLASLHVGIKQVERAAESLGQEISQNEQAVVEKGTPCSTTMYLGIDGTGCPVRKEETEGRKGKQPDGSSITREVKLAVAFSADSRDTKGRPVRDEGSVTYTTQPLRVRLPVIWMRPSLISPVGWRGKLEEEDLGKPNGRSSSATGRYGYGTSPESFFRRRYRLLISIMQRVRFQMRQEKYSDRKAKWENSGAKNGEMTWRQAELIPSWTNSNRF
jgi:hypothetical protein